MRVSNNQRKAELSKQVEILKQYAQEKGIVIDEILEEIGGDLDYERKKWNRV